MVVVTCESEHSKKIILSFQSTAKPKCLRMLVIAMWLIDIFLIRGSKNEIKKERKTCKEKHV